MSNEEENNTSRTLESRAWDEAEGQACFKDKVIFISGGTGSLGKALTRIFLVRFDVKRIVLFSRDELKQAEMSKTFSSKQREKLLFHLGDVRDLDRLKECMSGCNLVIHAAAMKHVDLAEMNPSEAIKTNVLGGLNVVDAAKSCKVSRVVALSTDKACNPVNLYGATKLCGDAIFTAANAFSEDTRFCTVRYGNVFKSRGSVVPFFQNLKREGEKTLPVTHAGMTRFNISLDQACNMVLKAFMWTTGGEMYVPKLPSYKILDLVASLSLEPRIVGIRPGEKIHEVMIPTDVARLVYEFSDHFVVIPSFAWFTHAEELAQNGGKAVADDFSFNSGENTFLTVNELKILLE